MLELFDLVYFATLALVFFLSGWYVVFIVNLIIKLHDRRAK